MFKHKLIALILLPVALSSCHASENKRLNTIINYKRVMGYTPGMGHGVFQIAKTIVENPFIYRIPFIGQRLKQGNHRYLILRIHVLRRVIVEQYIGYIIQLIFHDTNMYMVSFVLLLFTISSQSANSYRKT